MTDKREENRSAEIVAALIRRCRRDLARGPITLTHDEIYALADIERWQYATGDGARWGSA